MRDTHGLEPVRNAFWFMTQIRSCLVQKAARLEVLLRAQSEKLEMCFAVS